MPDKAQLVQVALPVQVLDLQEVQAINVKHAAVDVKVVIIAVEIIAMKIFQRGILDRDLVGPCLQLALAV